MKNFLLAILLSVGAAFAQTPQEALGHVGVLGHLTVGGSVSGVALVSIVVTPDNTTSGFGIPITYAATGTFSDGTIADITAQASWFVTPSGHTSNTNNIVTCTSGGAVTVFAQIGVISGSGNLVCQVIQIIPSGNLGAGFQNVPYSQQFAGVGGTPPYTFSSSDLPSWATLTGAGLLSGTPPAIAVYNFHVTALDSLLNTSGAVPMQINVQALSAEDNTYCNSSEVVIGLSQDGPANPLLNCNYTAVAGSPTAASPTIFVCPTTQNLSNGITPDPNCNPSATPPFYNTIQAAVNAADCGDWVAIYANNYVGSTTPQNVYFENIVLPPTSCFGNIRGWIWVSTASYTFLPSPGTRINPSWVQQNFIPGRPAYSQSGQTIPRLPLIECIDSGNACPGLATPVASAGASGWRFVGLEFTSPHGRQAQCPLNFNHTPQCAPGHSSPLVSIGCAQYSQSTCGSSGASHIVLDRLIVHACNDKSDLTCHDQNPELVTMQGGQHLSLIDSYLYGAKTLLNGVGPTVESHAVLTGNARNNGDDIGNKIVNNFIEASSIPIFSGGGASTTGFYPYDNEVRRNHLFRPLLWKINDPSFPQFGGSIYDIWVTQRGSGYANGNPGAAVTIDAPTGPNPIQATAHSIVSGGQVLDVIVDNPGSGYQTNPKITIAGGDGKAKAFPEDGTLNVKNLGEFKNERRVLFEGNVSENCWKGQSDQDCNGFLITPKNANNVCVNCTAQDITFRYNFYRNMYRGLFIGTDIATQCSGGGVCLPDVVARISVHDVLFDAIIPSTYVAKDSAFDGFAGTIFGLNNANPQAKSIQDVWIDHVTGIMTSTRPPSTASAITINSNCLQNVYVGAGIRVTNSILAGGVKDTASTTNGCYQCMGASCAGGSVTALNGQLVNDNLLPVASGNYTTGQVMKGVVDIQAASCSACNFTGGGGTGATCALKYLSGVLSVFPSAVGQNYTSAPAIGFTGCAATAHSVIAGAGIARSEAYCFDHNLLPTAAFPGEVPMTPYPTSQGSATSSCPSPGGGGNLTVATWADVHFVNLLIDGSGVEIPTGDLRLAPSSPGHLAANDGRDIGADINQILLKTGCVISGGVMTCP